MSNKNEVVINAECPAMDLLKSLSGKWKPQIFRMAIDGPLRFSALLRQISGSNKQSLANALREMEEQGFLEKVTIKQKPLHIEYNLTESGKLLIPVFNQLETMSQMMTNFNLPGAADPVADMVI